MIEKNGHERLCKQANPSTFRGQQQRVFLASPRTRGRYLPHGRAFQGRRQNDGARHYFPYYRK